jgi:hypothetical protein
VCQIQNSNPVITETYLTRNIPATYVKELSLITGREKNKQKEESVGRK